LISADPTIFVVNASRPWKSVKEFVDDAKKRPGRNLLFILRRLRHPHMAMEMLSHGAGIIISSMFPTPARDPRSQRSSAVTSTPSPPDRGGDPATIRRES